MNSDLVSVVVPVHDGELYLAEALESVLAQTHGRLDVIVVDDGSEDGSAEVARAFEPAVRVVSQPNRGAAAARNRGMELTRGDFFAFLDADDRWVVDKLERQLAVLARSPSLGMVLGHVHAFVSPELPPAQANGLMCPEGARPGPLPGTLVGRRAVWERVGPFDPSLRSGEGLDWLLRARAAEVQERMLADVVLERRVHPASHTVRDRASLTDYARVLKEEVDRRRQVAR